MNNGKIDLNELANRPDHQLTLTPREDPVERDSRLRIEEANATHQRRKELILHIAALLVMGVVLGVCVWTIIKTDSSEADKKWAVPILSAMVTGLIGYVTGRATK